ncbi:MAG: solute carrier family 23 protein, partial [Pseudomonadota bacterium]|nr:solute carrier family 23 protein [Pseudomonadota bacterium]
GVIQLTGIASRRVGIAIGIFYLLSGIFPVIGGILQAIPKAVLGGATLVMFAMVAVGGLKILMQQTLDRRTSLITASALGMGMGVMMVPAMTNGFPDWLANIITSPVTMAGITAVFLDVILPETGKALPKKHVFDNSLKEQKKLDPDLVQNTRLSHHEGAN